MAIRDQYNGRPLKTERPRVVPVHPELGSVLAAWMADGFELYTGHRPEPDDFIVPNISRRAKVPCHTRSSYYKAFTRFAEAAGIRPRSLHATRHTFITLCRRGGARKDVLERVTHNASGDIVDRYTHFDWAPLCAAVLSLDLDAHPTLQRGIGSGGDSGGETSTPGGTLPNGSAAVALALPGSIPGASINDRAKNGSTEKQRQAERQELERTSAELSAANRRRRRALLALKQADPKAAGPGLAICRALDAAYRGDEAGMGEGVVDAADALGWSVGTGGGST
jgi:hypothetical protein